MRDEEKLKIAREFNCIIEIHMKDISTVKYQPQRLWKWAQIAFEIAEKYRVNEEQIVLGGDHLGPFPWRNEDREIALANAKTLVNHMLKQDLGNFILI